MYNLPQAGTLANKLLRKRLAQFAYFKMSLILRLWKHVFCLLSFTLIVDNFGINYVRPDHANYLVAPMK